MYDSVTNQCLESGESYEEADIDDDIIEFFSFKDLIKVRWIRNDASQLVANWEVISASGVKLEI